MFRLAWARTGVARSVEAASFDLALVRIPAGKFLCPYHAHAGGIGALISSFPAAAMCAIRTNRSWNLERCCLFSAGEAHQLSNAGK